MKRAQLYLKNAAGGASRAERPPEAARGLQPQLNCVGWTEPRMALDVAVVRDAPPDGQSAPFQHARRRGMATRVLERYFGCSVPVDGSVPPADRAAERRRAWEETVVARHLLPESGAELLVLEGRKHRQ